MDGCYKRRGLEATRIVTGSIHVPVEVIWTQWRQCDGQKESELTNLMG